MSRPLFLRQLGVALVDRVRRAERYEDIMSDLRPEVPSGVDLCFVRRGARERLKEVVNDRVRAQLEVRVMRLLSSVD